MMKRRRDERGAVAILTALLAVILLGCAALAVDITSLSSQRQQLHDTLDTSALSGAMLLPDGSAAKAQALNTASKNDSGASPDVKFYCITGSKGSPPVVDPAFIPASCNPGPSPYTGVRCNASICSIPCNPFAPENDVCNAIELTDEKTVPFGFAPVLGIEDGSTGSLTTVACKGPCGTQVANPLDIAVIADRTSSMSSSAFTAVKNGVQGMLKVMTPSMQQVMFGMNSRSKASGSCLTAPAGAYNTGKWFPLQKASGSYLYNDYLTSAATPTLNASSDLVKGMGCMTQSSGLGTWLASPIDAAKELLTTDPNRNPLAKKAIVYMTDGEPNEGATAARPATARNTATPWGNTNNTTACTNAKTAATDAKAAGVMVVTIAYDVSGVRCNGGTTPLVTEQLAAMAGPVASADDGGDGPGGLPGGCASSTPVQVAAIAKENADGDYFFCAAAPADLATIFASAVVTIAGGTKLVWMP